MTTPQRIIKLWQHGESVQQIRGITGASVDYILQTINDELNERRLK